MNIGVLVLIVLLGWGALSIIVALAIGGMAKARDAGALPHLDHGAAPGRMAPPTRDEKIRPAI